MSRPSLLTMSRPSLLRVVSVPVSVPVLVPVPVPVSVSAYVSSSSCLRSLRSSSSLSTRSRFTTLTPLANHTRRHISSSSSFKMAAENQMVKANRLRQVFLEGKRPAVGVWQMLPGANISRALARSGVDWVMVDCEHGNMDDAAMHESVPVIASLGISPLVRIPDMQPWMIKRALDCGAHGVLVPLIRTVAEVKAVVAAAKFPPQGTRGFGSPFSMGNFNPVPTFTEYLQQANESLVTMVQIETKEALEVVEEIATLVDVVFIGPFDLGNNIGHPIIDGRVDPELNQAIARILAASKAAGSKCAIYCTSGAQSKECADQGFDMISCALDFSLLSAAMTDVVAEANGLKKPVLPGSY